ncbi:MAG: Mth938-like domain-containing protein [Ghiorsea sp.]|nr:Mth938-like domain-containing protein [Ghiorsea sp.]
MQSDLIPDFNSGQRLFHTYGDDFFQLGGDRVETSLVFHHGVITSPWLSGNIETLQVINLAWLEEHKPDLLVIGTGRRTAFPSRAVIDYLASLHVGYECMDSLSAARTFNILVGEGRDVSAAMLLPKVR